MPRSSKPAEILDQRAAREGQPEPRTPSADLGYATIQLPSRGVLYGEQMPEGKVQMRKMLAGEQARLQQQGGNVLERIEAIVNSCTRLPGKFPAKELLLTDSFFLMLALRTMSFGPSYVYRYRCRHCGSIERATVDIQADLEEHVAEDDLSEPLTVKLPDAGVDVEVRFLRLSDQDLITKHVKRTKMTSMDSNDPSYIYRLALSLLSRDGQPFGDLLQKQDFINRLTAADCLRIEKAVQDAEPGVDIRVFPDCGACGASNELGLPFDAEFFRPSAL